MPWDAACAGRAPLRGRVPRCPPPHSATPTMSPQTPAGSQAQPAGSLIPGAQISQAALGSGPHLSRSQIAGEGREGHIVGCSPCGFVGSCCREAPPTAGDLFRVCKAPAQGAVQPPQSPENAGGGGPFHNKSPTRFRPAAAAWSEGPGAGKERVPCRPVLGSAPGLGVEEPNRASKVCGYNPWGGARQGDRSVTGPLCLLWAQCPKAVWEANPLTTEGH